MRRLGGPPVWIAAGLLAVGLLAAWFVAAGREGPALLSHTDLKPTTARPDARVAYGPEPSQFAELWLPAGAGPHPVVLLLHGGCWRAEIAGLDIMDPAADDLRRRGYAVWNVEYRRLGEPGGGYPGAFQDVAAATDALRMQAATHGLDLARLVAVGHSAGAHLALWTAARDRLPAASPLRTADPLPVPAVLSLGGLGDLEAAAADPVAKDACGTDTIARLVDAANRPGDPYADTSPAVMGGKSRQVLLHGAREQIAPARLATAYRRKARAHGGADVEIVTVPDAGHFEVVAPGTPAWSAVVAHIERLSGTTSQNR